MSATPLREPSAPLASLILITYNQQNSVAEAIRGALAQTYSPLEILISDDASTDATFARAEAAVRDYAGPHTVRLFRREKNLGISAHLSTLAAESAGELLFIAAGDDISAPTRCERVMRVWLDSGKQYDLIATDLLDLDAEGRLHGEMQVSDLAQYRTFEDWSGNRPHVVGAAHAWSRRLFERFGPMEPGIYGEDQIMVFRAIMTGGAFTLREPLVHYRRGGLSRKRKWRTPAEFVARIKLANINGAGETRQLQRDAQRVGVGEPMRALLAKKAAREDYVTAMFAERSLARRLALLLGATRVSVGFRLRMFVYAACPALMRPFFFLKWHLRA